MDPEEIKPDIQERRENKDPAGEAWYAGLNSPLEEDSRALCTILMSHIGIAPRSKGVEYILTALEAEGNVRKRRYVSAKYWTTWRTTRRTIFAAS